MRRRLLLKRRAWDADYVVGRLLELHLPGKVRKLGAPPGGHWSLSFVDECARVGTGNS